MTNYMCTRGFQPNPINITAKGWVQPFRNISHLYGLIEIIYLVILRILRFFLSFDRKIHENTSSPPNRSPHITGFFHGPSSKKDQTIGESVPIIPSNRCLDFEVFLKIRQHDAFFATSNVLEQRVFVCCKKICPQGVCCELFR